ncbi:Iroquois homeobox protein 6a-like [Mytilus trossulus]|uniref:Iroquois homeobox protein 6a-like n=1 Tax=Mytilus trossulus TaxID=6551 RepID=UPI0030074618
MANMNSVWLNLPRPTPLPFEIGRNTTVEEMLGLQNILPVKHTITYQQNQLIPSVTKTIKQPVSASEPYHPVFSIICDPSYDRTERQSELLESRLHSYEINFPTEIDALFTEYYNITADIEMKKLTAVMESSPPYHCRINQYYNHQRQLLMYRIDRKLNSLVKPQTCQATFNTRNVSILHDWFNQHLDNPYPSREEIKKLSKVANINMQAVRVWFASERIRQSSAVIRKCANRF